MPRPKLRTHDDLLLSGRRWLVDGAPEAAVVLVHGFTANADTPELEWVAEAIHALGFDVIAYDARGHGSSEGESTLGDLERHDVAAATALARQRAERVVLVGASMGAIAVLRHAADDADLAGVVAVSCPAHWRLPRTARAVLAAGMTRTRPGRAVIGRLTGVRMSAEWTNAEPPIELAERIGSPVAFIHGAGDRFIPDHNSVALYERSSEPRKLTIVDDMGHAYDSAAVAPIVAAVEWVLRASLAPTR